MSQMQSNNDMQHQSEEVMKGQATGDSAVTSDLPDDYAAGVDDSRAHQASAAETSNDNVGTAPRSSDLGVPQEFTFFQKKKRADPAFLGSSVPFADTAQVVAFAARLDRAEAFNAKTHGHIAELMILMSDVAHTTSANVSKPTQKRLRWSKWLFYGCLVGFCVGWFLLFPSGHDLIAQLVAFFV